MVRNGRKQACLARMPSPSPYPDDTLDRDQEGVLLALAEAIEQRDHHIAGHCQRLVFLGVTLGMAMGLDQDCLLALYRGGYLHDVGKVGIPDSILFKTSELTDEEWLTMQSHTTRGEDICRHLPSMRQVLPIIRHHHEKWDGSGYPDGLQRDQIPLLARVLQVADIYDALTNERPYKRAFAPREAVRTIQQESDRGWRDPEVVKLFVRVHKKVIPKIPESDRGLESLRAYLGHAPKLIH